MTFEDSEPGIVNAKEMSTIVSCRVVSCNVCCVLHANGIYGFDNKEHALTVDVLFFEVLRSTYGLTLKVFLK